MHKIKKIIPTKLNYLEYIGLTMLSCLLLTKYELILTDIIGFGILLNMMIYISYMDIEYKIIPNIAIVILIILKIIIILVNILMNYNEIFEVVNYLLGFFMGGAILLLIFIVSKKSVGMGDVKLVAVLGLYLGVEELMSCIFISMVLAAISGITLIIAKKISKKSTIPFAPFLAIGTVMVVLFRM